MINCFGEEFTKRDVKEITERVRKLSLEQIDTLWYECGWEDSEKGSNKSLPDAKLRAIKENASDAKIHVENLLHESRVAEINANLKEIQAKK